MYITSIYGITMKNYSFIIWSYTMCVKLSSTSQLRSLLSQSVLHNFIKPQTNYRLQTICVCVCVCVCVCDVKSIREWSEGSKGSAAAVVWFTTNTEVNTGRRERGVREGRGQVRTTSTLYQNTHNHILSLYNSYLTYKMTHTNKWEETIHWQCEFSTCSLGVLSRFSNWIVKCG